MEVNVKNKWKWKTGPKKRSKKKSIKNLSAKLSVFNAFSSFNGAVSSDVVKHLFLTFLVFFVVSSRFKSIQEAPLSLDSSLDTKRTILLTLLLFFLFLFSLFKP